MPLTIYCPECNTLILDAGSCLNCGWLRPSLSAGGPRLVWRKKLDQDFGEAFNVFACTERTLVISTQHGQGYEEQTGTIIALDSSSGEERWRFELNRGRICRILALAGNTVVVCSQDTRTMTDAGNALLALDVTSGEPIWTFPVSAHSLSPPAFLEDVLFFTTNDSRGYALGVRDGALRWQIEGLPSWSPEPPAAGDGRFFIGSRAPVLTAIDAQDGAATTIFEATAAFGSKPIYQQDTLLTYCWDKHLYAVDVPSRTLSWRTPAFQSTPSPPVVGPYLYLGAKEIQAGEPSYGLYAFDLDTGEVAWRATTSRRVQAPPAVSGESIFAGDRKGGLYAFDTLNGDLKWTAKLAAAVANQPAIVGDTLYLGTKAGDLLAVTDPDAATPDSKVADSFRKDGKWEMAGTIAALNGEYGLAAKDYERLGDSYRVAQLYERAEMWAAAAAAYLAADLPAKAIDNYRRAGDQKGEADTLASSGDPAGAAAIYEVAGFYAEAAVHHERADQPEMAAANYVRAGDRRQAAGIYVGLGRMAEAALLLLEANDVSAAVAIYQQANMAVEGAETLLALDKPAEAVELLREAGEVAKAAMLLEQLEEFDSAAELYRQLGDGEALERLGRWLAAADVYLTSEPPMVLEAGRCLERDKSWSRAALLYAEHGFLERAAASWLSAGDAKKSRQLLRRLEPSENVARLLVQANALTAAAETWIRLGKLDEAVGVFRQAGEDRQALELLSREKSWALLRSLAAELQENELEAEACLELARDEPWDRRIDLLHCAAEAMVRAAEKYENDETGPDPSKAADLFEKSSEYFDRALDSDQATTHRGNARRLRKWPILELKYQPEGTLVAEQFCELKVHVTNKGYGPAKLISIKVISDLFTGGDVQNTQPLEVRGLLPQKSHTIALYIRPKKKAIGAVPLDFELSYSLPDNQPFKRRIRGKVKVLAAAFANSRARRTNAIETDDAYISIDPDVHHQLISLQEKLFRRFTLDELEDLCFRLGVEPDILAGDTKLKKVWSLVEYYRHRERLPELRRKCRELRPGVDF